MVLHGGLADDFLAVGVETKAPEANGAHESLGLLKLSIATEEGVNELDTGVEAELALLLLGGLEHGLLAGREEGPQLVGEALAGYDEVLDHLLVVGAADARDDFLGALDLAGELDQEEPEITSTVGHGLVGAVLVNGPVIDPLAQRVGVEDTA